MCGQDVCCQVGQGNSCWLLPQGSTVQHPRERPEAQCNSMNSNGGHKPCKNIEMRQPMHKESTARQVCHSVKQASKQEGTLRSLAANRCAHIKDSLHPQQNQLNHKALVAHHVGAAQQQCSPPAPEVSVCYLSRRMYVCAGGLHKSLYNKYRCFPPSLPPSQTNTHTAATDSSLPNCTTAQYHQCHTPRSLLNTIPHHQRLPPRVWCSTRPNRLLGPDRDRVVLLLPPPAPPPAPPASPPRVPSRSCTLLRADRPPPSAGFGSCWRNCCCWWRSSNPRGRLLGRSSASPGSGCC